MLLSKLKTIIALVLLSASLIGGVSTASMSRGNDTPKVGTASLASESVEPESITKSVSDIKTECTSSNSNSNSEKVKPEKIKLEKDNIENDSETLVTKEINCPKIGLDLLMDVPKSWEGKYYVKEYLYLYELGTDTTNNGEKIQEKCIKIIFKDPETKYGFPLITIVSKNNTPLDQIFLDNTIIKNFNGEEYAIGGPTDAFDDPKSALVKYVEMHNESIAVMKSLRTK